MPCPIIKGNSNEELPFFDEQNNQDIVNTNMPKWQSLCHEINFGTEYANL